MMFHIQYPAVREFITWDELGCLCRALGFPAMLIQEQIPDKAEEQFGNEHGLTVKCLQKMIDMKILYKHLHRTFNSHTADWNSCVILRSIFMLAHRVLDFEGLHQVRVAYMTYEHADMKGMLLDKLTLLRTLKMCGRTISPLKLMHRCKHMRGELEEKGRIQLYEFFHLILWCDLYTSYNPEDEEKSSGKDEELFKLVDFHLLLSHHDQRVSKTLDAAYLKEERDFGREALGSKLMFKEPVIYTETRLAQYIEADDSLLSSEFTAQTREQSKQQKENYRGLKREVGCSQRRLHRADAGTIRSRPISAPDLDRFRWKEVDRGRVVHTAQAAYETVQKRLHSALSKVSSQSHDRPVIAVQFRPETPKVVTPRDLTDIKRKMESLEFNINTLDARCQQQVENEMNFYIPEYSEKLKNRVPEPEPIPEPERKPLHWTNEIVNWLAYPPRYKWPAHARACDARFRGWKTVKSRPGYNVVLTSHTFENSEKGRMFSKMEKTTLAPVHYLHPEYVIRYTPKYQIDLSISSARKANRISDSQNQPEESENDEEEQEIEEPTDGAKVEDEEVKRVNEEILRKNMESIHAKYKVEPVAEGRPQTVIRARTASDQIPEKDVQTYPRGLSAPARLNETGDKERKSLRPQTADVQSTDQQQQHHQQQPQQDYHQVEVVQKTTQEIVPHMEHSGPKLVGVGQIGTIALLESIQESIDLEENFSDPVSEREQAVDLDREDSDLVSDLSEEDVFLEGLESRAIGPSSRRRGACALSSSAKARRALLKLQRRPSKSAPSAGQRKTRTSSGSTVKTPWSATTPRSWRVLSAHSRGSRVQQSPGGLGSRNSESAITRQSSAESIRSSSLTASSSTASELPSGKFRGFRGSVTSEEAQSPSRKTPADFVGQDSYSEDMTLASSVELTAFQESPSLRKSRQGMEEGIEFRRFAPDIQFDLASDHNGSSYSPDRLLPARLGRHSSQSERREMEPRLSTDFRDYLSDSGTCIVKPLVFSRESRSRLVGRIESVISPDMRMRLLTDDPKISVPAS